MRLISDRADERARVVLGERRPHQGFVVLPVPGNLIWVINVEEPGVSFLC
jgi:hypothetical protein